MAKIGRKAQLIFGGSLLAADNIAKFGSLKAGAAEYSLDPAEIQTAAFLNGWAQAVVNNSAPCLQDMNALFYLLSYQAAYAMQTGVPEWNATTVYYIGSVANDGTGKLYRSITDGNTNHALTVATYWEPIALFGKAAATGPTATLDCQLYDMFEVADGTGGNKTLTLANMPDGMTVNVVVIGDAGDTVTWTLTTAAAPDASALTLRYGPTYSNTMSVNASRSMFTLTRVGTSLIVNSLHGIV